MLFGSCRHGCFFWFVLVFLETRPLLARVGLKLDETLRMTSEPDPLFSTFWVLGCALVGPCPPALTVRALLMLMCWLGASLSPPSLHCSVVLGCAFSLSCEAVKSLPLSSVFGRPLLFPACLPCLTCALGFNLKWVRQSFSSVPAALNRENKLFHPCSFTLLSCGQDVWQLCEDRVGTD